MKRLLHLAFYKFVHALLSLCVRRLPPALIGRESHGSCAPETANEGLQRAWTTTVGPFQAGRRFYGKTAKIASIKMRPNAKASASPVTGQSFHRAAYPEKAVAHFQLGAVQTGLVQLQRHIGPLPRELDHSPDHGESLCIADRQHRKKLQRTHGL